MKESRHPHPHIDPRQPRNHSQPQTNPPVFAWKPPPGEVTIHISGTHPPVYQTISTENHEGYDLLVSLDADFSKLIYTETGLKDPVFLPEKAFPAGNYWWKWTVGEATSEVFEFQIDEEAVTLEVPEVDEWLERLPKAHPRLQIRPEELDGFRTSLQTEREDELAVLIEDADSLLAQSQEIAEPGFLPDRKVDYAGFWKIWYPTMWGTRRYCSMTETRSSAVKRSQIQSQAMGPFQITDMCASSLCPK